jgi:hypothetical protein
LDCRESAGLPDYRCYVIEPDDHIRHAATVVQCDTDAEALTEARRLLGNQVCIEVWACDRRVATLYPNGLRGAPVMSLPVFGIPDQAE